MDMDNGFVNTFGVVGVGIQNASGENLWEFFFRGFLQFGIKKHYGVAAAILVPAILTVLMHIGKPEGESWGALIGGIYLGLLALRTRSMIYPLIFHWYSGMLNTIFVGII